MAGTLVRKREVTENGQVLAHANRVETTQFMRSHDLLSATTERSGRPTIESILVGPRYAARLQKSKGASAYSMVGLVQATADLGSAEVRKWDAIYYTLESPRELASFPWEEVIRDPGFTLRNPTSEVVDGRELFRFEFEYHSPKNQIDMTRGTATLLPESNWAVQNYQGWFTKNYFYRCEYSYRPSTGAGIDLREMKVISEDPSTKVVDREVTTFKTISYDVIPESTFSLTAFGLPELPDAPATAAPAASRLYLWLYLGAALLFLAAIGVRLRRRPSAAPAV